MAAGSSSARTAPGPTIYTRNQRPAPAPTNGWSPPTRTKIRPTGQADGAFILYRRYDPRRVYDIFALRLADGATFPIVETDADERNAQFSPDGRWVVYQSNESGRFEIWVQPFSVPGSERRGKWQISNGGGGQPRRSRDGHELFYLLPDSRVMAVPIKATADGEAIETGRPSALFRWPGIELARQGTVLPPFMVSKDGQRFLFATADVQPDNAPLTMILNWENEPAVAPKDPGGQILFFAGLSSGWDNPIRGIQKILPPATRVKSGRVCVPHALSGPIDSENPIGLIWRSPCSAAR